MQYRTLHSRVKKIRARGVAQMLMLSWQFARHSQRSTTAVLARFSVGGGL